MRILALETSYLNGSVAVLEDDRLLGQTQLDSQQRTAQFLAPAIAGQLKAVGWRAADIQLAAVTQGPGSFTGLRVGVATAKTLAYAVGAEVMGVNTLRAIAAQAPQAARRIWAVMDAQRQQLFAALFQRLESGDVAAIQQTQIIDNDRWMAELVVGVAVTGPGLHKLMARLPDGLVAAEETLWAPRAATIGQIAYRDYQAGRRDDVWKLAPHYYRRSAAEEKLDSLVTERDSGGK